MEESSLVECSCGQGFVERVSVSRLPSLPLPLRGYQTSLPNESFG